MQIHRKKGHTGEKRSRLHSIVKMVVHLTLQQRHVNNSSVMILNVVPTHQFWSHFLSSWQNILPPVQQKLAHISRAQKQRYLHDIRTIIEKKKKQEKKKKKEKKKNIVSQVNKTRLLLCKVSRLYRLLCWPPVIVFGLRIDNQFHALANAWWSAEVCLLCTFRLQK